MIYKYSFLMFFLLTSCSFKSKQSDYLYKMIDWHGKKYTKNAVMALIGTGGSIPEKINYFSMHYVCEKEMSIDEVRILFVNAVEDMIEKVNSSPEIFPYLRDYPINCDNVSLAIAFRKDQIYFEPPKIAFVSGGKQKIFYDIWDNEKQRLSDNYYVEKYEDALRIVVESGQRHQQMHLLK